MCKKFLSIMLTLMMILSAVSVNVSADTAASQTKVVFGGSTLSQLSKGDTYSSMTTDVTLISNSSLKLTGDGTSSGSSSSESRRPKFASAQDWTDYSYINFMAKNASETASRAIVCLSVQNNDASGSAGYWYKSVNFADMGWTVVSVPLSEFAQAYTGTKIEGDKYSEMNTITAMFFDGIKGEFYVDSIWLSTELPAAATCTETSVANGSTDVLMDATEYTFTYSASLADSSKQNPTVIITEDGAEFGGEYSISYDANQIKVTFAEMLKPGATYSIDVSGIYDSFGIVAEDANLSFSTSETIVFPDEVVIADFTKLADLEKAKLDVDTDNKLFGEKSGTFGEAKISAGPNMDPIALDGVTAPTDWSKYTHFNFWMYSKEINPDIEFVMVLRTPGTSGNSANKVLKQDFAGWKKFSIPLSDFYKGPNFDITNVQDAYVSYTYSSINGTWDESKYKKVSFAKMWLSSEGKNDKEIFNSDSTSATKAYFSNTYAALNQDVLEDNDMSLKLTGTGDNANESRNPTFAAQDWTGYNYINFRMKNAGETEGKFNFYATVNKAEANGANGYWTKGGIRVTSSEWQTISIPIPSGFTFTYNSSAPTVYTEMSHIEGLRFDYINGTMYLEKIWLSAEDCSRVPAFETVSVADGEEVSSFTRKIDFTYSEKLSSKLPTIAVTPAVDYVAETNGNTLSVIFPDGLSAGKSYTVTVGADVKSAYGVSATEGASVSFTTESYSTERSESAVYARYASSDYASGKMFVATYNADDTLANVSVVNGTVSDGVLSISNDYVALDSTMSARIFVWDGATLRPLTTPVNFN